MPYIPHTEAERDAMLKTVGVATLDDLFADIAPDLRPQSFLASAGLPEQEVRTLCEELAARNTSVLSFLGAGFYDHYIPAAVDALAGERLRDSLHPLPGRMLTGDPAGHL